MRKPSTVARGPITDRMIVELEVPGFPVGDNAAPEDDYGWQGEPDEASTNFIPWLTIAPGPGSSQSPPGAMGDTGTMWRLNYTVFYAGITRGQCERLADRVRNGLCGIARENINTETGEWRIMKVTCTSIGSVNRIGSAYPDHFTESDNFEVWVSKEG